jgi:hypothetical protein
MSLLAKFEVFTRAVESEGILGGVRVGVRRNF